MSYAEVTVVVDGAQEALETFYDSTLMDEFVSTTEQEAKEHGYLTEVFVLDHDHPELEDGEECACVQYLTDHHPRHTFNGSTT